VPHRRLGLHRPSDVGPGGHRAAGNGSALSFGGLTRHDHRVGIIALGGFSSELGPVEGFLSLAFFEDVPFTVDYTRGAVSVESRASADERTRDGSSVPVRLERDGPAVDAFMQLDLPGARAVEVEIDMGSDSLILDERLAGPSASTSTVTACGAWTATTRRSCVHEVLHAARRLDLRDRGASRGADRSRGDVPADHLRRARRRCVPPRFTVTYDLPRERVVFVRPMRPSRLRAWST
jgi:hypothetical protein